MARPVFMDTLAALVVNDGGLPNAGENANTLHLARITVAQFGDKITADTPLSALLFYQSTDPVNHPLTDEEKLQREVIKITGVEVSAQPGAGAKASILRENNPQVWDSTNKNIVLAIKPQASDFSLLEKIDPAKVIVSDGKFSIEGLDEVVADKIRVGGDSTGVGGRVLGGEGGALLPEVSPDDSAENRRIALHKDIPTPLSPAGQFNFTPRTKGGITRYVGGECWRFGKRHQIPRKRTGNTDCRQRAVSV